ncbi:MAG TPA: aminotransferase class V-fold PLP-dependent enzyme [Candidatus Acidoferrales bacterium]|nr:aminotransferase class V-fold PLP-dependent enzyme [Candidatus Acidoferrales bacterium]
MLNRRSFLTSAAGLAGAGFAGATVFNNSLLARIAAAPRELPADSLLQADEDAYWAELRKQFLIPEDEVYLNAGTVGSSPAPVLKAVFDGYNETEKMAQEDPEDYPLWGYGALNEFRGPLAAFIGCGTEEIALVRNATEANNYATNGIDMKAGDEVLTTDQEHGSGYSPWELKAKRYGIVMKKVSLPRPVENPAQVLNLVNDAITPRTRVLFFSHITTDTGVVLPAKELCALARSKGILSVVDGAQAVGMMRLHMHEIGCDVYTSSPHKWLVAPKGTGFLFVRDEVVDRIWSTVVTGGWDTLHTVERFQHFGSANLPALWGLRASVELANRIGMERIEKRHRQMADYIHAEMIKRGAQTVTSPDPAMRCAIATVNVPPIDRMQLELWMWKTHKIRIRGSQPSKLRLCTPYYLLRPDIDRFLEKFEAYKREKNIA